MALALQTLAVMFVTWLAVLGAGRVVRRLGLEGVQLQLGQTLVRLILVVGIAVAVAVRAEEHRAVLVFAVGAAYFAAVVGLAWYEAGQARKNSASMSKAVETSR